MRHYMLLLPAVLLAILLTGCGEGVPRAVPSSFGTGGAVEFTIDWPVANRLLPTAARSLRFVVTTTKIPGVITVKDVVVARPAGATSTTVRLDKLPEVALTIHITACPISDGSGTPQAEGTLAITLTPAQPQVKRTITLDSTIHHLLIEPDPILLEVDETKSVLVTAWDVAGRMVLLADSKVQWLSANETLATVEKTGTTVTVTCRKADPAPVMITVTETESGKEATVSVKVGRVLDHLVVTPATLNVIPGKTATLSVLPVDSAGNVVPISDANFTWTSTSPTDLELVTATGKAVTVLGKKLSQLAVTVTVQESVSKKTASATVTVKLPGGDRNMIWIPAGEFVMGTSQQELDDLYLQQMTAPPDNYSVYTPSLNNEKPQHTVYLDGYWIDKYEVTMAQFSAFCTATGYPFDWTQFNIYSKIYWWPPYDNKPMACLLWADAKAYADWAGVSLPTEAQWEKAARGARALHYPWGNAWSQYNCANYYTTYSLPSAEITRWGPWDVGSFRGDISPYGVMDMAGNVRELCTDWFLFGYYAESPHVNPTGPATGSTHVARGGTFDSNQPYDFTCMRRTDAEMSPAIGFRCVLKAPGPTGQ